MNEREKKVRRKRLTRITEVRPKTNGGATEVEGGGADERKRDRTRSRTKILYT